MVKFILSTLFLSLALSGLPSFAVANDGVDTGKDIFVHNVISKEKQQKEEHLALLDKADALGKGGDWLWI